MEMMFSTIVMLKEEKPFLEKFHERNFNEIILKCILNLAQRITDRYIKGDHL